MPKKIRLADFITQAVDEIIEAHRRALARGVSFLGFEECEIECGLESEIGPKGEVNILAVKIGASGKQTTAHKVRVLYKPFDPQKHSLQAAVDLLHGYGFNDPMSREINATRLR